MAILEGAVSGNQAEVEATHKALRGSIRPDEALGWFSLGEASGLVTAVAAAGPLFSLRNIGTNLLCVRRVSVGFIVTTAFTTAQALAYKLIVARNFTASDTGGTAIALTGSNNKLRTSLSTFSSLDCRIATTAALGAGTRVLDTYALGIAGGSAQAIGASASNMYLLQHDAGDHPLILAQNEGLVITNQFAMGAVGVINFHVNIEFGEMSTSTY